MRTLYVGRVIASIFILFSLHASAQQVQIKPIPSWVAPHEPDLTVTTDAKSSGSSYYLLLDRQENIAEQVYFKHHAYKILTSEGVQEMSDITATFDPAYEKLTFHKVVVYRKGQVINKLSQSAIRTMQREQSMDRYLYDGSLSAVINLQDIREGDVVEFAYSVKGYNPVFDGHYTNQVYLDYSVPTKELIYRLLTPASHKLNIKYGNGEVSPVTRSSGSMTEYTWTLNDTKELTIDNNLPGWYDPYRYILLSDFDKWSDVASWAQKHFRIQDAEKNQLKVKVNEMFGNVSGDSVVHKAIRFVQDEVRYLGFESGLNSHKPHPPLKIFEQRFGDCKDKSLLLSTILNIYGVEAYPMLVNTTLRGHISDYLPSNTLFNHCVVQIIYQGDTFYIDPTINNQGGTLGHYYFPAYGKGLVIRDGQTDLIELPKPTESSVDEEQTIEIKEAGTGYALLSIRTTYSGDEADTQRSTFASNSIATMQKGYISFYSNLYPDIVAEDTLLIEDNRAENIFTIKESYRIPSFWKTTEGKTEKLYGELYAMTLETYFNVSKSTTRTGPYYLTYPLNFNQKIRVKLPESWNAAIDSKVIESPFYSYIYSISYNDAKRELVIDTDYKTLQDYIPASDVPQFVEDHTVMMRNLGYNLTYDKSIASSGGGSHNNLVIGLAVLVLIISANFGLRIYRGYDPEPELPWSEGQPIGGWLVLVGIGITFSPLALFYFLFISNASPLNEGVWVMLVASKNYVIIALRVIEIILRTAGVIFSILVVVLFYQRRTSLPKLIMIFYGLNLAITILTACIGLSSGPEASVRNELYLNVFKSLLVAAIWIPYFNTSVRVRETFVERSKSPGATGFF
ncbi:MAG TPA: DUF3857 domain-containing protein [Ohtaekwangia sp.]|uniref:DUF3857 domain-containing protein n=1 Tax=Ohtaekwangia sp. TaxID=2066019 RepID=UPI002F94B163